jgi:MFS family permease
MVDLTLFGNPNFSANLATGFIQFVTIAGVLILLPFYLENTLGYSIRQVGMLLAAIPITLGILAPISGHLSDRMGTRPVTVAGLTVSTIGFALAASLYGVDTGPIQFIAAGLVIGAGIGLFQSPNNSAILGAVPANRLGITSGMLTINRITGQIVGIAVLGTIWAARTTSYAGGGTAESAAPRYQAAGLRDTFIVATFLLVVAIGIAVAAWRREARTGSLLDG